jgi:hypothetical protein
VADAPSRSQAGLPFHHLRQQLVGTQASLHEEVGLAGADSSTAFSAAAWLWGASTISILPRSSECSLTTAAILAFGPTRIGFISPASAASIAPYLPPDKRVAIW